MIKGGNELAFAGHDLSPCLLDRPAQLFTVGLILIAPAPLKGFGIGECLAAVRTGADSMSALAACTHEKLLQRKSPCRHRLRLECLRLIACRHLPGQNVKYIFLQLHLACTCLLVPNIDHYPAAVFLVRLFGLFGSPGWNVKDGEYIY